MKFHVVVIMYYARYEASFDHTTRFESAFGISISLEKESRGRPRQRNGCIQVGPGEACGDVARLDALLCFGEVPPFAYIYKMHSIMLSESTSSLGARAALNFTQ